MIRIQIFFKNGRSLTVGQPTARETVDKVEAIMLRHMQRIQGCNVIARGENLAEGARIRNHLKMVELDTQIDRILDRDGLQEFDLYEIAKHPRRRKVS